MGILTSYIGNQMGSNPSSAGDFMSDYVGRRFADDNRQAQANAIPKTTTITTDESGDTTVTQKQTISRDQQPVQVPQQIQPAPQYINLANSQGAPVAYQPQPIAPQQPMPVQTQPFQNATQSTAPQPQAPVAPVQAQPYVPPQAPQGVFGRMIQAESGGQQYNPQGGILTSPKGAQGIAQIMPSTAAQPGYGIKPATPQELATPQGNMLFGQRYFEGMYNKFGQDPEKAAAAYNAGPGTIERAMQTAAQQGGTWKDYIPDETKKYLDKVIPAGEAATKKYGPMLANANNVMTDSTMSPEERVIHSMVLNSGDVNALGTGTYAGEHLIDPATKKAYADQHASILQKNKLELHAEKRAQQLIADGGVGMQRALKDDSEEGSYLKAYLFHRLGLNDLAKAEQQKLGAGDMWAQTMVNGAPAWVKFNGQGAPVKGYTAEGELSGKDLINTLNMKGVTTHTGKMQDVVTGKIYYEQTTPMGPRLVDNQGNVFAGDSANLRAYGIGSDVATKNIIQLQTLRNELANKPKIKAAEYLAEFNAKNGTNYTMDQVITSQAPMTAAPNQAPITGGQPAPAAPQPGTVEQVQQGGNAVIPAQGGAVAPQAPARPAQVAGPAVPQTAPAPAPAQPAPAPANAVGAGYQPKTIAVPTQPNPGEPPAAFEARRNQIIEANKKITAQETQKMYGAENIYSVAKEINDTLPKATGSYIGAKVDQLAGVFGHSTEGAKAIAQLQVLGNRILMNVPRFEGPQSDRDTQTYKDAAGDLANPNVPVETRIAAFKIIQDINKKYAPELNWDFAEQKKTQSGIKIISREKVQ
jgi:soluble lytic murein transglycosylase